MIRVLNVHILNIGKRLKQKELFEEKCRQEFEALFSDLKVAEPDPDENVIKTTVIQPNGLKVIVRKRK